MKKCILCGKEHERSCDKSNWDVILRSKFNIPDIEEKALEQDERQHVAKKRGRKPKNG